MSSSVADSIYAAKMRERRRLAALPIEEKIKRLVEMQQRAHSVAVATGRKAPMVWKIPFAPSTT